MKKTHTKELIVEWLVAHPLINLTRLERDCGIPHSSISNAVKGNLERLSEKHLPKIVEVLKLYGYR